MLIGDFFEKGLRNYPGAVALVDDHESLTFAEADAGVGAATIRLRAYGATLGSRIALYAGNSASAYMTMLAIWRAGCCCVSLNPKATAAENADMIDQSGCALILCPRSMENEATAVTSLTGRAPQLITFSLSASFDGPVAANDPKVPSTNEADATSDDVAWMVFTGGTTGSPKGVMLTHAALYIMTLGMQAHLNLPASPSYLVAAPMTHAAGTLIPAILGLGGHARFLSAVDPTRIASDIAAFGINVVFLPPTAIYMLLALPDIGSRDFSSLTNFVYAAAPMAEERLAEAMNVFGPVMTQMYGQSEYPMLITFMSPAEHAEALAKAPDRLASCGRETIVAEIAVMDTNGEILPTGNIGEIVVRGPIAMKGYLGAEHARALSAGDWLHTGDIGRRDADGFLFLLDRKKDMIITGGFNVYSVEVENVLLAHPKVAQCAVIGVPDAKWGEAVKAIVEFKPGQSSTPADLIALCKAALGSIKAPKTIEIWPELPRNSLGKVLKRDIRDSFWERQRRSI